MARKDKISDELLAAYLDGKTTEAETLKVLNSLKTDPELRETLKIALDVEGNADAAYDVLPMLELAAESGDNICSVLCEAYVLHRRGIDFVEKDLLELARQNRWLTPQGTPLYAIGLLLARHGLMVTHQYDAVLDDIVQVLQIDNDVLVAVDSDKLYEGRTDVADAPNHAVVVLSVDAAGVQLFDSAEPAALVTVPRDKFLRAWNESSNYMVRVLQSVEDYVPRPVNLDDVELTDTLVALQEAIAENAHDVWASIRAQEGWTYGPCRDDAALKHPDLIPYTSLPDSEKEYDRRMALDTIRLVQKLGFDIIRKRNQK